MEGKKLLFLLFLLVATAATCRGDEAPLSFHPAVLTPSLSIAAGARLNEAAAQTLLDARRYVKVNDRPAKSGEYTLKSGVLQVITREFLDEDGSYYPKMNLTVYLGSGQIENKLGPKPDAVHLEPMLLSSLEAGKEDEKYSAFARAVALKAKDLLPPDAGDVKNLRLFTPLHPVFQGCADQALRESGAPSAAVVAIGVENGEVIAWSERAKAGTGESLVLAERNLGSLAKAFVYLAAVDQKYSSVPMSQISPAAGAPAAAEPVSVTDSFDPVRAMMMEPSATPTPRAPALREVVENLSGNETTAIAERIGMQKIDELLAGFHLERPSLLDVTAAFAAIAAGGRTITPKLLSGAQSSSGQSLTVTEPKTRQISDPISTFLLTDMLRGTVNHGAAASLRQSGLRRDIAALPGRSSDNRNYWFVGYTPQLALGVWLGGEEQAGKGDEDAKRIWTRFMICGDQSLGDVVFQPPIGVRVEGIDRQSFQIAGRSCPRQNIEAAAFRADEPQSETCTLHGRQGSRNRGYNPDDNPRQQWQQQQQQAYRQQYRPQRRNPVNDVWNTIRRGANNIWRR